MSKQRIVHDDNGAVVVMRYEVDGVERVTFGIEPRPKPRMTRRDRWNPTAAAVKYFDWKSDIQKLAALIDFKLPDDFSVAFFIRMPKGKSKKWYNEHAFSPHKKRPDVDNLAKAIMDSLSPLADSNHWRVTMVKRWAAIGEPGFIKIHYDIDQKGGVPMG